VLPPNLLGYVRYCPYPFDPAKAKQLVQRSGTKGQAVTVWTARYAQPESAYFVSVLAGLGYKARLKVVGGPGEAGAQVYFTAVGRSLKSVQAGHSGWLADYPEPDDFFTPLLTCASYTPPSTANFGGFSNHRIDREIANARALQTTDRQAAAVLWSRIDHQIVDQAPWVAKYNDRAVDFTSRRTGNTEYNPWYGVLYDQLWVR
jgi:ABC-type transport system substrate-binding protein